MWSVGSGVFRLTGVEQLESFMRTMLVEEVGSAVQRENVFSSWFTDKYAEVRNWRPSVIGRGLFFPRGAMRREELVVEYFMAPLGSRVCSGMRSCEVGIVIVRLEERLKVMLPLNLIPVSAENW